jgi:hypothetical protein
MSDPKAIAIKELVSLFVEQNPAIATAMHMDTDAVKAVASSFLDIILAAKEEPDLEHGEFFLLRWESGNGDRQGSVPTVQARFLSRTCALDMAKMLNTDLGHGNFPKGPHYDVASVGWMVKYAQMVGKGRAQGN